jgi:hypothetical protein
MSALRKPDDRYALTHVSCVTGDTKIKTSRCDFQIRPIASETGQYQIKEAAN